MDWNVKPRPPVEFFSNFSVPSKRSKWSSRLKCNGERRLQLPRILSMSSCSALRLGAQLSCRPKIRLLKKVCDLLTPPRSSSVYYYRANYFVYFVFCFVVSFFRHPVAFVAVGLLTFTTLLLNDSLAHSVRCVGAPRVAAHGFLSESASLRAAPPLPSPTRLQRACDPHGPEAAPAAGGSHAQPGVIVSSGPSPPLSHPSLCSLISLDLLPA